MPAKTSSAVVRAVILARGLGTRMRCADNSTQLSAEQSRLADSGLKAMLPVGRPFLDYVLSALADAGLRNICLVVGPEHTEMREYYGRLPMERLRIRFAIQDKAIGTANALLSAEEFAGGDVFMVLNSDNYYPVEMYRRLCEFGDPALAAFERTALVRESNINEERVRRYSIVETDAHGDLARIIEKPDETVFATQSRETFIGMNCWLFRRSIFRACREVRTSSRGELELPEAVQLAISAYGERIRVLKFYSGVLDLSYRSDVAEITRRLAGVRVRL